MVGQLATDGEVQLWRLLPAEHYSQHRTPHFMVPLRSPSYSGCPGLLFASLVPRAHRQTGSRTFRALVTSIPFRCQNFDGVLSMKIKESERDRDLHIAAGLS